jgi:hypothetical protein
MVLDEDSDEETVGPVCRIVKTSIHVVPLSSKRQIHFAIAVATGDSYINEIGTRHTALLSGGYSGNGEFRPLLLAWPGIRGL